MKGRRFCTFYAMISFLLCMFTVERSLAQSWISSNAVWHYNFEEVGGILGYHKIEYIKDTIILGETCEYLQVVQQTYIPTGPPNWTYYAQNPDTLTPRFTFLRNDTVFYYNEDKFSILYCLNATPGQSWDLGVDTSVLMCSESMVNVINTGFILLNGQDWPMLEVISNPDASFWLAGRIVSRFGCFDRYLFPQPQNCDTSIAIEFPNFFFSCFRDDDFPLIQAGNYDCDNPLAVGLSEVQEKDHRCIIYPNPACNYAYVRILEYQAHGNYRIMIFDPYGTEIYNSKVYTEQTPINISRYPAGLYHVLVFDGSKLIESKKLVKT